MRIELLIGMIGSGKSYYAKQRALNGALVSNDDAIVTMIHGGVYNLYNKQFKPLYKIIENQIIHYAASMQKDLIIDRTNFSVSMRKRYISIAQSLDIPIVAICFPIFSLEKHARIRFQSDSRQYTYEQWLEIAKHHFSKYTAPTIDEGFSSIIYIPDRETGTEEVLQLVKQK